MRKNHSERQNNTLGLQERYRERKKEKGRYKEGVRERESGEDEKTREEWEDRNQFKLFTCLITWENVSICWSLNQ